jgi:hypothetical protein
LAIANNTSGNVGILLGNGNGSFQAAVNYSAGSLPYGLAIGDFDNDGKLDLAVSNQSGNNVSALLGNGNGTFQSPLNFAAGTAPYRWQRGLNADGLTDLVTANVGSNDISVLLGVAIRTLSITRTGTGAGIVTSTPPD